MTFSVSAPTNNTGALLNNGTEVLSIDSSNNVSIPNSLDLTGNLTVDTNTLYVDSTNNRVGIGTTTPSSSLHLYGSSSALRVERSGSDSAALITKTTLGHYGIGTGIGTATNCFNVYDYNASAERMRIDSNGTIIISPASANHTTTADTSGFEGDSGYASTYFCRASFTSAKNMARFYNPNGKVGSIITSGTATSYNTSSDYRLKENNVNITDGISRVKLLKPYRFNFITDADTTVDGFFAHEVQDVVPEAIHGTKDAVDDEGNPDYQAIDQSKLVPLLTAALQEAITKIESLEERIQALESN